MSKDKGSKNTKKAPADKTAGKNKPASDYKAENKNKQQTEQTTTKPDTKTDGSKKS